MTLQLIDLFKFSRDAATKWMRNFDSIFTDCDGTLWHDDVPIPGVADAINLLQRKYHKRVFFVTNNGTKTREEIWEKSHRMGFQVELENIIAPAYSIAEYLDRRNNGKPVYIVGSEAMCMELSSLGIRHNAVGPDPMPANGKLMPYIEKHLRKQKPSEFAAVVVGFDEHFSYGKMMKAANILGSNPEAMFLATNNDPVQRYPCYSIPDTGAMLSAIEACCGRKALIMGKPNPMICEHLLESGEVDAERTLMIGDSWKADIPFALNCGFTPLIVGPNNKRRPTDTDFAALHAPIYKLNTIADFLKLLN